jgi:trehalose-6-phosphate synthase
MNDFFIERPEWIGKVVLIQLAIPSREGVEEYQKLKDLVNKMVEKINEKFGKQSHSYCILLLYPFVPCTELAD